MTIPESGMDAEKGEESTRSFRYSWSNKVLHDSQYEEVTKRIKRGCPHYLKCILAWSTNSYPTPNFLVDALSLIDENVELIHTWTRLEEGKIAWSGSVAFYKKWSDLEQTAEYVIRNYEDIRLLWFPDMVNLLTVAERSHRLFGKGSSKLVIKGRRSLDKNEALAFQGLLKEFGEVKMMKFLRRKTEYDTIAVVYYGFVTHAFVAKFQMNGRMLPDLGYLGAEVEETEKEKDIREAVVTRIMEHYKTS